MHSILQRILSYGTGQCLGAESDVCKLSYLDSLNFANNNCNICICRKNFVYQTAFVSSHRCGRKEK